MMFSIYGLPMEDSLEFGGSSSVNLPEDITSDVDGHNFMYASCLNLILFYF